MVRTKNIYQPRDPEDGSRLLVMRKWPRGTRKEAVDAWDKDLGPSLALLQRFRQGHVDWGQMAREYTREMESRRARISELAERARGETVTLLCSCKDEGRCHRSLLKGLIEAEQGKSGP